MTFPDIPNVEFEKVLQLTPSIEKAKVIIQKGIKQVIIGEGEFNAVGEFADKNKVTNLKRGDHGSRGDLVGCGHRIAKDQGDKDRDENGFGGI